MCQKCKKEMLSQPKDGKTLDSTEKVLKKVFDHNSVKNRNFVILTMAKRQSKMKGQEYRCNEKGKKRCAPAENRTRGPTMATLDFTTKPLALTERRRASLTSLSQNFGKSIEQIFFAFLFRPPSASVLWKQIIKRQ